MQTMDANDDDNKNDSELDRVIDIDAITARVQRGVVWEADISATFYITRVRSWLRASIAGLPWRGFPDARQGIARAFSSIRNFHIGFNRISRPHTHVVTERTRRHAHRAVVKYFQHRWKPSTITIE